MVPHGNKGNVKRKRFSPPPKNSINLLNLSPCVWQLRGGFFLGGGTSRFSNNKKWLQLNPETHSWASGGSRGSLFSISNDTI